jgi:hypothetical protein
MLENVAELNYLGITVINQNYVQKETMIRLNSGDACYYPHVVSQFQLYPNTKNVCYSCMPCNYYGSYLHIKYCQDNYIRR